MRENHTGRTASGSTLALAIVVLGACSLASAAPIVLNATAEKWIRQANPDNAGFENDLISVWSTAAGDGGGSNARYGLVEFDMTGLAGATLQSARLRLYSFVTGSSSDTRPIRQRAYAIDSGGTTMLALSWNLYQSEKHATRQELESLGRYDLPPVASTPDLQGAYADSTASTADLAKVQAELDGDRILTLVLIADEDGTDYRKDWGDAAYGGLKAQLVLDDGSGCNVTTTSLPGAFEGEPYSQTIEQDGGCTNAFWSIAGGALPVGLNLDSATGAVTGTPDGVGTYPFTVQVAADQGVRTQDLSIRVAPFTGMLTLPAAVDVWISESFTPDVTRENDFISVYSSTAAGIPPGRRVGLVQWNVSALAGKTLKSARMSLAALADQSSAPLPMRQVAYRLEPGPGSTPLGSLTWNSYQAEQAGHEAPFESLGSYNLGPTLSTGYVESAPASPADLAALTAAAGSASGLLNVALFAVENGTDYRADWGDIGLAQLPPLLLVDDGTQCVIATDFLPDGQIGAPYSQTLQASGPCAGPLAWSLTGGLLPDGLSLDPASGELSGTPTVAGVFRFTVRMEAADGRFRRRELSISVPSGSTGQIPAGSEVWVWQNDPGEAPPRENDLISVWSTASGGRRVGLVEFDVGSLSGAGIVGAQLSLYATRSSRLKQVTSLIPTGPTKITGTSWNKLLSEKLPAAQPFDRFGTYDLVPGEGLNTYVESMPASAADLAMIAAEAAGDGKLTLALLAEEDGNDYRQDWGDAYNSGSPPLLIVQLGGGCVVLTASLPGGVHGQPYNAVLQATPDCGASPEWTINDCYLPAGLSLDPATGTISGIPGLGGDFLFSVQIVPAGPKADLAIHIQPSEADLDGDLDVDLDDASLLAAAYTGPGGCDLSAAPESDVVMLSPVFDAWIRDEGSPGPDGDFVREGDLISVWSSDFGPARYGLVRFDLSALAGKTLASLSLELYNPVTGFSSDNEPIRQAAWLVNTGGGTPMGPGLNWGVYQAEYEGHETALESLGAFEAGATSTTPEIQNVYLVSTATANDRLAVQAAASSATHMLDLVFKAAEDGTGYKRDWGDLERTLNSQPPRLVAVIDSGQPCRIATMSLPGGTAGQPYSAFLSADGGCTGTLQWSVALCHLPPGLSLNAATGEISGTPALGGSYPVLVQLTSGNGTRTRLLTLHVAGRDADFDNDGDVDLVDLDYFALRFGGPLAPAPSCSTGGEFPSTDTPLNIPDGGSVTSTIQVAGGFTIGDVNVYVDATHGFQRDFRLELVGPDGTTVILKDFDLSGGGFRATTFDDEGTAPVQALSAFDGKDAAGSWKLIASDYDAIPDNGVLNAWTLILAPQ